MKKFFLLATFAFLITNSSFLTAQKQGQAKLDSLLSVLTKAKDDTNKVNILVDIASGYRLIHPDKGLEYAGYCLTLAQKLNWKKGIAKSYNVFGVNYWVKSDLNKALEYYFKSLKMYQEIGNKTGIALNLGNIGLIYQSKSDYTKALEYYFKSLKIAEELGNKESIARNLGNIGFMYYRQSDYTKALEYDFKSLKIAEELGNKFGIEINLQNIGNIYYSQSNYTKALEYYFKSLKISEEIDDKGGISSILCNIGIVYLSQYDYPKALEYNFKAIKINKEIGNKEGFATIFANIGEIYIRLSQDTNFEKINERNEFIYLTKKVNLKNGIMYCDSALKITKEIGDLDLEKYLYQNLSNAYRELGNFKQAYEYLEMSHKLKDSVFSKEKTEQIANLEANRENDLKQKEIELLKANEARRSAELKNRNWQLFGSLFAILMLFFVMVFVIRERKKSEDLLLNVLPPIIAKRLKAKEHPIADHYDEASVVFIDMVDFTKKSFDATPKRVAEVLNTLYTKLDRIAKKHGLEKIKTIGDCYMAASGIPIADGGHARKATQFATEAMTMLKNYDTGDGTILQFRCGVDCGPVAAGVIGEHKFIYDVWGDTVNMAARMEQSGKADRIHITERFAIKLGFGNEELGIVFEQRDEMEIKGKGIVKTYFMN